MVPVSQPTIGRQFIQQPTPQPATDRQASNRVINDYLTAKEGASAWQQASGTQEPTDICPDSGEDDDIYGDEYGGNAAAENGSGYGDDDTSQAMLPNDQALDLDLEPEPGFDLDLPDAFDDRYFPGGQYDTEGHNQESQVNDLDISAPQGTGLIL
jgi:hypothetical protein